MAEVTAFRNNALPYPVYGVPWAVVYPFLDADGDLVTGATTPDAEVSLNGNTFADCTNESVEIATSSGVYYLLLTGAEMTADIVTVIAKSATAGMKTTVLTFYPRKLVSLRAATAAGGAAGSMTLDASASAVDDFYNGCLVVGVLDSLTEARIITDYTGSTKVAAVTPNWNTTPDSDDTFTIYLPEGRQINTADVTLIAGAAVSTTTAQLGVNVVQISTDATAADNAEAFFDGTGYVGTNNVIPTVTTTATATAVTTVNGLAAGVITATSIAADAITAAKVADGTIDAATFAAGAINAAAIATDAITAAKIAADAIGASELAADAVTEIQSGLATAAALTTVDDFLDTEIAAIIATLGSAGAGLTAVPWNAAWDAEVQSEATDALNAYDPPTNTEMEARTIAAASYATAAALTIVDDFLDTEIAAIKAKTDNLPASPANEATLTTIAGYLDTEIAAILAAVDTEVAAIKAVTDALTAAAIADAVWEEVLADHLTSGTTGAALNGAGAAGDPWGTALPGAYGAGTAGKIIGDNVNATISSRSTVTTAQVNTECDTALSDVGLTTTITGRVDAAVSTRATPAQVNTEADTALSDVGLTGTITGRIDAAVTTRATPAQVNTEVVDALNVDTYSEPSAAPAATVTLAAKIGWLFMLARNRLQQTSSAQALRNDGDSSSVATSAVSDDGVTAVRDKWT